MDRDEFLSQIADINVWRQGDTRAPHKPLLLLLGLARLSRGEDRMAGYGAVIEQELTILLKRFGPPRRSHHPDQPYRRLPKDGLWELSGIEGRRPEDLSLHQLRQTAGGFPGPVQELLDQDPLLKEDAFRAILDAHFPPSLHEDLRDAVGLPGYRYDPSLAQDLWAARSPHVKETPIRTRDPQFRHRVLRAYERRCAVCDFDVRIEDQLLGLEAAHIKWHAAGGPDWVSNGLALCSLHHKALDVGALGLDASGTEVTVLVSSEVNGQSAGVRQLLDFRGAPLRQPRKPEPIPDPDFVAWHRSEVFREPALEGL